MPVSRKRKPRKTVGARSAKSGKFVRKEKLETAPATTIAVTREVEPEPKEEPTVPDRDAAGDEEC